MKIGYSLFDEVVGIERGTLTIISGPAGSGKSTVLNKVLRTNFQKVSTLFVPLDGTPLEESLREASNAKLVTQFAVEDVDMLTQILQGKKFSLVLIDAIHFLAGDNVLRRLHEAALRYDVAIVGSLQIQRTPTFREVVDIQHIDLHLGVSQDKPGLGRLTLLASKNTGTGLSGTFHYRVK